MTATLGAFPPFPSLPHHPKQSLGSCEELGSGRISFIYGCCFAVHLEERRRRGDELCRMDLKHGTNPRELSLPKFLLSKKRLNVFLFENNKKTKGTDFIFLFHVLV